MIGDDCPGAPFSDGLSMIRPSAISRRIYMLAKTKN
jgi:hypothetical protein